MLDMWNHIPHGLQAIVLGNLIQGAVVLVLSLLRSRFAWIGPAIDRFGPRSLRSKDRRRVAGGFAVAVAWFLLSWYVGHQALRVRGHVVAWLLRK